MADLVIDVLVEDSGGISVVAGAEPQVSVSSFDEPATVVTIAGPRGPRGEPGPAFTGTAWWYGEGEPGTIIGSKPGDMYVDTLTGIVYRLGD